MEIKVRSLDVIEPKSVQEVEKELLDKHEQSLAEGDNQDTKIDTSEIDKKVNDETEEPTLKDEDVLSYIGKRYNKQINSLDELVAERQSAEQLPEDVAAYMKFKKETGRGFEDFLKLKEDYDSMDPEQLLKQYLSSTQEGLDEDDIDALMDDYRFDEDIDDESTIKKVKIARKKVIAEAKKYFTAQKEKYKVPLESSTVSIPDEEREAYQNFKQYVQESKTIEEENNRKRQWFDEKTNEVFGGGFKGFEFDVNGKKVVFAPGDSTELKRLQSNPSNFISKFLDESGLIKDAVGYHKSLSVAMNPEKFAKFFYEQGMADATEGTLRNIKNINMGEQKVPAVAKSSDGVQVKAVNPDSGRNLKIRSMKRI